MTQTVLYYTDSHEFGGMERAMLQHMEGLNRQSWLPVLVFHPSSGIAPLLQEAQKLDVKLVQTAPLPLGYQGGQRLLAFKAVLHREHPAIFHAHLSWPLACKWGLTAAIFERIPGIVATLHLWVDTKYTPASRWQQRMIADKVGRVVTVSQNIAHKLEVDFGISPSRLQVIHSSVDDKKFESATLLPEPIELGNLKSRPVVLTVARLDQQKGLSTLLEAAAHVPEASFVMVGDGPERFNLEMQCSQLGLQNRVLFAGFRPDVAAWLGHCDLFVLPSLYEGMPISLLEAMAAGKPVIASAIPGNLDVISAGQTGLLVQPGDPIALADAIHTLLADRDLAVRMAKAGQAWVKKEFSTQRMNQQVMDLYTEILTRRAIGARRNA